jgi:hypothetical protein
VVYYDRAREWSRSARVFTAFVERRVEGETEAARASAKAARAATEALEEHKLQSGGTLTTSVLSVLKEQEAFAARQLEIAVRIKAEVLVPLMCVKRQHPHPHTRTRTRTHGAAALSLGLNLTGGHRAQREEHDRTRKRLLAEYEKEKRKLADHEAQLARIKARYITQSQVRLCVGHMCQCALGLSACPSAGWRPNPL